VKAELRRLLFAAIVAALFGLLHALSARWLAGRDLLGALLNQLDPVALLLGLVIAFTRLVLFFLVPGWLLYRAMRVAQRALSERETTARRV